MKTNKLIKSITCLILLALSSKLYATNYYVDTDGSDTALGTSITTAWKTLAKVNSFTFQPGDKIFFKRGQAWTGQLYPKGSGTAANPIVIDAYGTGALPIINGNGIKDASLTDANHTGAALLLKNQSYWTVQNLEVTNPAKTTETDGGVRQGIKIVVVDDATPDTVKNILIKGVIVKNIGGKLNKEDWAGGKLTAGISIFIYRAPSDGETDVTARFNNIIIEECTIDSAAREGIMTSVSTVFRDYTSFDRSNYPIDGLIIRKNIIQNCAGNGLIVRYANSPLIENNRAVNNHYADEDLVGHGVALWCRSTNDAVFQFNEIYNTQAVSKDGFALDADLSAKNTIFQYNYSHDNLGGFVLFIRSSTNSIVRYNISQRDGRSNAVNRIFHFSEYGEVVNPTSSGGTTVPATAKIYNNTIFIDDDVYTNDATKIAISNFAANTSTFSNNIFYNSQGGIVKRSTDSAIWEYNHFENFPSGSAPMSPTGMYGEGTGVNTNTTGNAYLQSPGTAGNLINVIGTANSNGTPSFGNQLDAYKISNSYSPVLYTGCIISDNGLRDFYNNPVSTSTRPHRGAYNECIAQKTVIAKDAFVRAGTAYKDTNYGSQTLMFAKESSDESFRRRALVGFTLDGAITSSQISTAKLKLYCDSATNFSSTVTVSLYKIPSDSWYQSSVTYDNAHAKVKALPPTSADLVASTTISAVNQYYDWDITDDIKAILDGGFKTRSYMVVAQSSSGAVLGFNTRESATNKPFIEIVTTCSSGSTSSFTPTNSLNFLEQKSTADKINVYPNPVKETLFISLPISHELITLEIFDLQGRLVKKESKTVYDGTLSTNVSLLKTGVYIIKLSGSTKQFETLRIIKE
ncbi:DUF7594 domain-containing protein [Pedobacter glucosidilyticus]|uniref:CBM96 family carbohydrate-binding protein n=1 Tax=Pedobacter glucosidilyticus TaxID=1122941 RepID=UPI0026F19B72|nr:DNRLRE domain-containing protein [Pedobacter glucosidilyticus]